MPKRTTFKVSLLLPKEVSVARMTGYILDAVSSWGGQFDPHEDPLFSLEGRRLRVESREEIAVNDNDDEILRK